MTMKESGEMYLETIYILSQNGKTVRGIDISEKMGYSKPSVSRAVGILKKSGFIEVDKDGGVRLTESGKATAERIYERHLLFTKLLINLGVDEKIASEDACRVEHYISDETFEAIKAHVKKYGK